MIVVTGGIVANNAISPVPLPCILLTLQYAKSDSMR